MSANETPSTIPAAPAVTDDVAAAYITHELAAAHKAHKRSLVVGLVLVAVIGGYISFISFTMVQFFRPRDAAQVASGMLAQHIASDGTNLALQVERQIPLLIRQVPDYIIRELPSYRQEAERAMESELRAHCVALGKQLGEQLDEQLDTHQSELKSLFEHPNDRAVVRAVLPDLDQTITGFLTIDADGKVVQEYIADLAAGLKEVEKRMDRLANGSNLTPEEQKARRSLAVLAKAIKDKTKVPDLIPAPVGKLARK